MSSRLPWTSRGGLRAAVSPAEFIHGRPRPGGPGDRPRPPHDPRTRHLRSKYHLDTGEFLGTQVYLGELRTDAGGRLLFLGGRGVSASQDGSPATDFANNDGWYDDIPTVLSPRR
jgi:hypothetical protein